MATTGTPAPSPSAHPPPGAQGLLQRNFLWIALQVLVAGAVGAISAYLFVQNQVDARVQERVRLELPEALKDDRAKEVIEHAENRLYESQQELGRLQGEAKLALERASEAIKNSEAAATGANKNLEAATTAALVRAGQLEARAKELDETIDLAKVLNRVDELTKDALANLDEAVVARLAAIRMLFDWLVVGQVVPVNPAAVVRGPRH